MEAIKLPLKQGQYLDWEAYDADDKVCFIAFDGDEASPEKTAALVKIINQRDELLEALQNVLKAGRGSSGRIILEQEDELQIIAAIAKAKG